MCLFLSDDESDVDNVEMCCRCDYVCDNGIHLNSHA